MAFRFFLLLILLHCTLFAGPGEELMTGLFAEGVTVDLREPTYADGVLSTECGGVITGPDIRIQAMKITYIKKMVDGKPVFNVVAEGDLLLEYSCYIFAGKRLEYDFQTKTGFICNGRSAMEPWYFGGERIELCSDGSYRVINGFITTSESYNTEWEVRTEEAQIYPDHTLRARNIQFRFVNVPLLWLPCFNVNLDNIFDSPLKYRMRWGGNQGPRFGIIYEFLKWKNFRALLRLDYRLTRGPGGGLETIYHSPDRCEELYTNNYYARDSSIEDPDEKNRYRFAGLYRNRLYDGRLTIDLTYDKLSDKEMETDYFEKGIELKTAQRTQLDIRQQLDDIWITNFFTRVRVNNFQTVKQELPSLDGSLHPVVLGPTGIVTENLFRVGYLDFKYSNDLINVSDYSSARLEYRNRLYRPFWIGPLINTPEAGFVGIYYSNSDQGPERWVSLATLGYEVNTRLSTLYGCWKHAIEPYARYSYFTTPTVSPNEHFIFDIEDGWYRLNMLKFGTRNLIYLKHCDGHISRYLTADLYTYAFFDTHTIEKPIPRLYGKVIWDIFSTLRYSVMTAWDFERGELDHINVRSEWTLNEDFAIAAEYRHRSSFAWRKADYTNFILDSFRSEVELRNSQLSDRRDTLLLHAFYRFHPNWAIEFESRHGWNRLHEPSYNEYEIDLLTTVGSVWHLKFSYQHRMSDNRVAFYVNMGASRPECRIMPCYTE